MRTPGTAARVVSSSSIRWSTPKVPRLALLCSTATTTSTKRSLIACAVARFTTVLKAMTDPKAETGSVARAFRNASAADPATAMPHGVVCLMIAQQG